LPAFISPSAIEEVVISSPSANMGDPDTLPVIVEDNNFFLKNDNTGTPLGASCFKEVEAAFVAIPDILDVVVFICFAGFSFIVALTLTFAFI
jgi:hypothetical protein